MHAVRRIDLQAVAAVVILYELVHPCGAITLLRPGIQGKVDIDRDRGILERQVAELVFLVIDVGNEQRPELVESEKRFIFLQLAAG